MTNDRFAPKFSDNEQTLSNKIAELAKLPGDHNDMLNRLYDAILDTDWQDQPVTLMDHVYAGTRSMAERVSGT